MRLALCCLLAAPAFAAVPVVTPDHPGPRELFAAQRLRDSLAEISQPPARVVLAVRPADFPAGANEAFHLWRTNDTWLVTGSDPSGVLYGAQEFARRVATLKKLPDP